MHYLSPEGQVPILEITLSQQCQHLEMRATKKQFGNSSLLGLLMFPVAPTSTLARGKRRKWWL